jgi:hypothetical protein
MLCVLLGFPLHESPTIRIELNVFILLVQKRVAEQIV